MPRKVREPKPLTELGERIQQALDAAGLSQGKAEQKAGLSDALLSKWMTGPSKPGSARLLALANALGVDFQWLAFGRGTMRPPGDEGPIVELDDRYPNKARAIAKARREGYSEEAIAAVQAVPLKSLDDLPETEWSAEIHAAEQRVKKFGTASPGGRTSRDDDDARSLAERVADLKAERAKRANRRE